MFEVRAATPDDALAVSTLAEATFREAFAAQNTAEDMEAYVAGAFSADKLREEIQDPRAIVPVAELSAGEGLAGYAHLVVGAGVDCMASSRPIELKRLYVAPRWHGRGVAQALMDAAIDSARDRGAEALWLAVWEHNPRAVAFYGKYGFTRIGEHEFLLGSDKQTDWVLARPV